MIWLKQNNGIIVMRTLSLCCSTRLLIYGGLKVGPKRLWIWPPEGPSQQEITAMSILDFYVHESVQRMGVGKQLFQVVMKLADFGDA